MRLDVVRRRTKGRKWGLHLHDTGTDDTWPYALADSIWSFADAAPHAPAADAWSFASANAPPHTRADAEAVARADAGPDAGTDARPNDG